LIDFLEAHRLVVSRTGDDSRPVTQLFKEFFQTHRQALIVRSLHTAEPVIPSELVIRGSDFVPAREELDG
jgi:hypothetical protein